MSLEVAKTSIGDVKKNTPDDVKMRGLLIHKYWDELLERMGNESLANGSADIPLRRYVNVMYTEMLLQYVRVEATMLLINSPEKSAKEVLDEVAGALNMVIKQFFDTNADSIASEIIDMTKDLEKQLDEHNEKETN